MPRTGMLLVALLFAVSIVIADDPPPFGSVVDSWQLPLGSVSAGAGITWRNDSGLLYIMNQRGSVWKLSPDDPVGTLRRDTWVLPNLGAAARDLPWGIAYDRDSGCFWVSQIVDGNTYTGGYLVRMVWSDSAWCWGGSPADSWCVSVESLFFWIAGMAKRSERGYFVGAAVVAPPAPSLHKFDPYAKRIVGATGNLEGCRPVALVPADSYYIVTGDTLSLVLMDSLGRILHRATPGGLTQTDVELVYPAQPMPFDTVFLYAICSDANNTLQKISAGMLWGQFPALLPPGMRALSIIAPVGTVDSGETVVPTFTAQAVGPGAVENVTAGYRVDFSGGGFVADSVTGLSFPAGAVETLALSEFVATARDSMSATFWVRCPVDTFRADDTVRNRSFVRVTDAAIPSFHAERDTYDQGDTVNIQGRVENRSNVALSFDLHAWVSDSQSTRNINLLPGGMTEISAGGWVMPPGIYLAGAEALVPDDMVPDNNAAFDTFVVRGQIEHDYAALAILEPSGVEDTLAPITPTGLISNLGTQAEVVVAFLRIHGPDDSVVFSDSMYFQVDPGDSLAATFQPIRFTEFGIYTSACSVHVPGEQNNLNDKVVDTFEVAPVGVADQRVATGEWRLATSPNPVTSGFVFLSFTGALEHLGTRALSLCLYDACGRRVLHSSLDTRHSSLRLDLRSMPAGVYVLRISAGTSTSTRKVVLQH